MKYILVALKEELPDHDLPSSEFQVWYTGVGKVNASIFATLACIQKDCDAVINYGTAGTLKPELAGQLLQIGTVRQRDMDARPQADLGVTPFDNSGFDGDISLCNSAYVLSTGDNFVKANPEMQSDFVDMEGYAIAKVAGMFNKPCMMLKYASDLADDKAPEEWEKNQAKGKDMFLKWLDDLEKNIQEINDE